jgi:ligand-binding SRPBCC domain-containing protein
MRFSYHSEQWLSHPAHRVFEFFANPGNLPLLMPMWQKVRIEKASILPPPRHSDSPSGSEVAGVGSQFTIRFRPFPFSPLPIRWQAEITEFSWYQHFCDEQIHGPFTYWKHGHYFRPVHWNGFEATVVADDVEYELPLGVVGSVIHRLFVRRQLERTFKFRQRQLNKVLASVMSQSPQPQRDQAVSSERGSS